MRSKKSDKTAWRRLAAFGALFGALAATAACDNLLEVDLPSAVTEEAVSGPGTAATQVNAVLASVECGYSSFAMQAAGYEDNFQRASGSAGTYSEYDDTPDGGACGDDAYNNAWFDHMFIGRKVGYDTYESLLSFTDEQVPNRTELLAETALYIAVALDVAGEHFCEFAVSPTPEPGEEQEYGELLTPDATLTLAEAWVDSALVHINDVGDYEIEKEQGVITESALQMAHGLRARIRWAMGDLTGAAEDAELVEDGFYAYVLREPSLERRNMVSSLQGGGGGVQPAGFLQGPVELKTEGNEYGVTLLGSKPNGEDWDNPVPFTGYLDLAIDATGRAVDADGYPITTSTAGATEDVRVPTTIHPNTAGGEAPIPQKYGDLAADIPLVSWVEMRLIRAEAAATPAEAVEHVNAVRNGDVYIGGSTETIDLPDVAYGPTGEEVENMILEERRRGLWLEGRYWSTKILNPNKLWFPRNVGQWVNESASYSLGGGVRLLMQGNEYEINRNLSLADRGTGCAPEQAPVYN